jgi:tetratricopeptide (TPR) repeat protein
MQKFPKYLLTIAVLLVAGTVAFVLLRHRSTPPPQKDFAATMIAGKNAFEAGNAAVAVAQFARAVELEPNQADAHLNFANACLFAGDTARTIAEGQEVLRLDANSAAALYVIGCAQLRQGNAEEALKALQQSRFIDSTVAAVSFQIGHAHLKLGQSDAAVAAFREAIALEPQHPSAHYALSQALMRVKDTAAAQAELARPPGNHRAAEEHRERSHLLRKMPAHARGAASSYSGVP